MDEFFDVLRDEPLDRWYQIGNVITVVNAKLESELSDMSEYLLASETLSEKDMKAFDKAYKDFEYLYYMAMSIVYGVTMATILPFIQVYTKRC